MKLSISPKYIKQNNLVVFLIMLCIFISFKIPIPGDFFELYYSYVISIFLTFFFLYKFRVINIKIVLIFSSLLIIGVVQCLSGNNTYLLLFKVGLSTFFSYTFYFYCIKYFNFDLGKLFKIYLTTAFCVAALGIFQVISFQFNFEYGYNYSWLGVEGVRFYHGDEDGIMGLYPLHSLYGEPAHFGAGMAPAIFASIISIISKKSLFISKPKSCVILIAAVLTTATTSYFAMFVSILLIILSNANFRYITLSFGLIPLIYMGMYNNIEKFKIRIDDIFLFFTSSDNITFLILDLTGTTRALINNFYIAIYNFKEHFLFGTGLGSHAIAYYKYTIIPQWHEDYGANYNDANSLFNRLISETGLVGIIFSAYFLYAFFLRKKNSVNNYYIINNAGLVMILTFFLRQGHYFSYGFPLFVLFYYYSFKLNKQAVKMPANS